MRARAGCFILDWEMSSVSNYPSRLIYRMIRRLVELATGWILDVVLLQHKESALRSCSQGENGESEQHRTC